MAARGDVIENPRIGQRAAFLDASEGELVVEFTHRPGGGVGDHLHVRQSERFEMLAGEIDLTVDGRRHRLVAGDSLTVPPRAVHSFEVIGAQPARIRGEFRPAGFTEEVFRGTFDIDARRAAGGSRLRRFVEAARLARSTGPDFFWLPRFPWWLQAAVLRGVARLADLGPAGPPARGSPSPGRDQSGQRPCSSK
jgi:quercetin dioxygenase-like cupin family protein